MTEGMAPMRIAAKYRTLVSSIALFLVLDLCVLVLNFTLASQIQRNAVAVNLAGRQRMLSQRMMKALYRIDYAEDHDRSAAPALAELHATVGLFDHTLNAFAHGGTVPGGTGRPVHLAAVTGAAAEGVLHEAFTLWKPYHHLLSRVHLNAQGLAPHDSLGQAIRFGAHHNLRLLGLMNQLTTAMQNVAAAKAARLRLIQVTALMLALANFALILFHFLRQLAVRDQALEVYERSLERLVAEKDGEIGRMKARYEALLNKDAPKASEAEQARRRIAVHHALGRFREKGLSADDIMNAIDLFEERYNAYLHITLTDFVRDVTRLARVPDLRPALHAEVLKQFGRPRHPDDVDPLPAVRAYRQSHKNDPAETEVAPLTASFALALGQVLDRLEALDRGKAISLRMFLATRLHSVALDGAAADELRDYLVKPSRPALSAPVALQAGQTILHMVWEWCQDGFGARITRSVFQKSVEKVRETGSGLLELFPRAALDEAGTP